MGGSAFHYTTILRFTVLRKCFRYSFQNILLRYYIHTSMYVWMLYLCICLADSCIYIVDTFIPFMKKSTFIYLLVLFTVFISLTYCLSVSFFYSCCCCVLCQCLFVFKGFLTKVTVVSYFLLFYLTLLLVKYTYFFFMIFND